MQRNCQCLVHKIGFFGFILLFLDLSSVLASICQLRGKCRWVKGMVCNLRREGDGEQGSEQFVSVLGFCINKYP